MMPVLSRLLPLALLALLTLSPAFARGPGTYAVAGKEASGARYTGSATLTSSGNDTWRISWKIGGQVWTGYGIGDGKIISMNFSGNGQTGVMLLVSKDDDSGYQAAWAYTGDKRVSYEDWSR